MSSENTGDVIVEKTSVRIVSRAAVSPEPVAQAPTSKDWRSLSCDRSISRGERVRIPTRRRLEFDGEPALNNSLTWLFCQIEP